MKQRFKPLYVILIILGMAGGFLYYYFIGCATGSCPLKSNPWIMTGYGALIGYLLADVLQWIINHKHKSDSEK